MTLSPDPLARPDLARVALEHMAEAVVVADAQGLVRLWNRGAEVLFGFSAAEALGSPLTSLLVPERFQRAHDEGFRRALATGQLRTEGRVLTTRSKHKWGSRLYVDFTFRLVRDEAGTVCGVVAVGRDATARHLEEVAARVQGEQADSPPASPAGNG